MIKRLILNLSIKNKLIVVILMVSLSSVIVAFAILASREFNRTRYMMISSLDINTRLVGDYCIVPLYFVDKKQAVEPGNVLGDLGGFFSALPESAKREPGFHVPVPAKGVSVCGEFHV